MITYVLFNRGTAHERTTADLHERLKKEQLDTELVDADSPRGIQLAENYDVLGRPAVILVRDDGSPIQVWQGVDSMPSPSDVAYFSHL